MESPPPPGIYLCLFVPFTITGAAAACHIPDGFITAHSHKSLHSSVHSPEPLIQEWLGCVVCSVCATTRSRLVSQPSIQVRLDNDKPVNIDPRRFNRNRDHQFVHHSMLWSSNHSFNERHREQQQEIFEILVHPNKSLNCTKEIIPGLLLQFMKSADTEIRPKETTTGPQPSPSLGIKSGLQYGLMGKYNNIPQWQILR